MPIEIIKLEDEPIVITTMTGKVTAEDLAGIYQVSMEYIDEDTPYLYRITDVRNATSSFPEMTKINVEAREKIGAISDSRIRKIVAVGSNQWSEMYREAIQRWSHGRLEIPVFTTLEEALTYVRELDRQG